MKYTNNKRLHSQLTELNQEFAEKLFKDCNILYFNNELPDIPITLIKSDTVNGNFTFNIDFNTNSLNNLSIQLNTKNKRTKNKLIATMVHEMLHYKVALEITADDIKRAIWYYNNEQIDKFNEIMYAEKHAHSKNWLKYANIINNKYNLDINLK